MLLPMVLAVCFLTLHVGIIAYKASLGRTRNLTRHSAPLVSSLLLLMYIFYIFICKTAFDVVSFWRHQIIGCVLPYSSVMSFSSVVDAPVTFIFFVDSAVQLPAQPLQPS